MKSKEEVIAFYDGLVTGVMMYAHWKDGTQYVGTTGKTLRKALEDIEQDRQTRLKELGGENNE